jgi:hypothetical protein
MSARKPWSALKRGSGVALNMHESRRDGRKFGSFAATMMSKQSLKKCVTQEFAHSRFAEDETPSRRRDAI